MVDHLFMADISGSCVESGKSINSTEKSKAASFSDCRSEGIRASASVELLLNSFVTALISFWKNDVQNDFSSNFLLVITKSV